MSDQSMTALALANEVRIWRADLRKRLAAMPRSEAAGYVAASIVAPPNPLRTIKPVTLVKMLPGVGKTKAEVCTRQYDETLEDLSPSERFNLAKEVRQRWG